MWSVQFENKLLAVRKDNVVNKKMNVDLFNSIIFGRTN